MGIGLPAIEQTGELPAQERDTILPQSGVPCTCSSTSIWQSAC